MEKNGNKTTGNRRQTAAAGNKLHHHYYHRMVITIGETSKVANSQDRIQYFLFFIGATNSTSTYLRPSGRQQTIPFFLHFPHTYMVFFFIGFHFPQPRAHFYADGWMAGSLKGTYANEVKCTYLNLA